MPTKKKFWLVTVATWGETLIYDTEERAEAWRRHKANWEQSIARKREIKIDEASVWIAGRPYNKGRDPIDGDGQYNEEGASLFLTYNRHND